MHASSVFSNVNNEKWIMACQSFTRNREDYFYTKTKKGWDAIYINNNSDIKCFQPSILDTTWTLLSIKDAFAITKEKLGDYRQHELKILEKFIFRVTPIFHDDKLEKFALIEEIKSRALSLKTKSEYEELLEQLTQVSFPSNQPAAWLHQVLVGTYLTMLQNKKTSEAEELLRADLAFIKQNSTKELNLSALLYLKTVLLTVEQKIHQLIELSYLPTNYSDGTFLELTNLFLYDPKSNKIELGDSITKAADVYLNLANNPSSFNPQLTSLAMSNPIIRQKYGTCFTPFVDTTTI